MPDEEETGLYERVPDVGGRNIMRRGYTARRRGKTIKVRRAQVYDTGAPGKWRHLHMNAPGIGPLKSGLMAKVGYSVNAKTKTRRVAVKKAVKKYGPLSTLRKLNAVAVYTRRTSPGKSRRFKSDVKYIQKKYY